MEIKTVQDLIPYKQSLKVLWLEEEFQPFLAFLSSLRDEQIVNFRRIDLSKPAEQVKTEAAIIRSQINTVMLMLELPKYIQEAEDTINHQKKIEQNRIMAQESSSLEGSPN